MASSCDSAGSAEVKGKFMLQGWKNMHPEQHYIQDHIDLCEHIDQPAYIAKEQTFETKTQSTCRGAGTSR
jgi:hypothetical protein